MSTKIRKLFNLVISCIFVALVVVLTMAQFTTPTYSATNYVELNFNKDSLGRGVASNGYVAVTVTAPQNISDNLVIHYETSDRTALASKNEYTAVSKDITLTRSRPSATIYFYVSSRLYTHNVQTDVYYYSYFAAIFTIKDGQNPSYTFSDNTKQKTIECNVGGKNGYDYVPSNGYCYFKDYDTLNEQSIKFDWRTGSFEYKTSEWKYYSGVSNYSLFSRYVPNGYAHVFAGMEMTDFRESSSASNNFQLMLGVGETNLAYMELNGSMKEGYTVDFYDQKYGCKYMYGTPRNQGVNQKYFTTSTDKCHGVQNLYQVPDKEYNSSYYVHLTESSAFTESDKFPVVRYVTRLIDTEAPKIVDYSVDEKNILTNGGYLYVQLRFSEPIRIENTKPSINATLQSADETNIVLNYIGGSSTDTLVFGINVKDIPASASANFQSLVLRSMTNANNIRDFAKDQNEWSYTPTYFNHSPSIPSNFKTFDTFSSSFSLDLRKPSVEASTYSRITQSVNVNVNVHNCKQGVLYYKWTTSKTFEDSNWTDTNSRVIDSSNGDTVMSITGSGLNGTYYLHVKVVSKNSRTATSVLYGDDDQNGFRFDNLAPQFDKNSGTSFIAGTGADSNKLYHVLLDIGDYAVSGDATNIAAGLSKVEMIYENINNKDDKNTVIIYKSDHTAGKPVAENYESKNVTGTKSMTVDYSGTILDFNLTADYLNVLANQYAEFKISFIAYDAVGNKTEIKEYRSDRPNGAFRYDLRSTFEYSLSTDGEKSLYELTTGDLVYSTTKTAGGNLQIIISTTVESTAEGLAVDTINFNGVGLKYQKVDLDQYFVQVGQDSKFTEYTGTTSPKAANCYERFFVLTEDTTYKNKKYYSYDSDHNTYSEMSVTYGNSVGSNVYEIQYEATNDIAVVKDKKYYSVQLTVPKDDNYYYLQDGIYTKSNDAKIITNVDYYKLKDSVSPSPKTEKWYTIVDKEYIASTDTEIGSNVYYEYMIDPSKGTTLYNKEVKIEYESVTGATPMNKKIIITINQPGYLEVSFTYDTTKHSDFYKYYFTNSFDDKTENYQSLENYEIFNNKVFLMGDGVKFFYMNEENQIVSENYNNSSSPVALSSKSVAYSFAAYYEYQDLRLVKLTDVQANLLNGSLSEDKMASSQPPAAANQYWIKYKSPAWNTSSGKNAWVYYYYGSDMAHSELTLDLIQKCSSLNAAINAVVTYIVGLGTENVPLVGDDFTKDGLPYLAPQRVIKEDLIQTKTRTGNTVLLTFTADKALFANSYYSKEDSIKYVSDWKLSSNSLTRILFRENTTTYAKQKAASIFDVLYNVKAVKTTDTALNTSKTYYIYDDTNKTYKKVTTQDLSNISNYYEITLIDTFVDGNYYVLDDSGNYVFATFDASGVYEAQDSKTIKMYNISATKTLDNEAQDNKTYYALSENGSYTYTASSDIQKSEIANYYEAVITVSSYQEFAGYSGLSVADAIISTLSLSSLNVSSTYTIMEYDQNGARIYQVFVDKKAPVIKISYKTDANSDALTTDITSAQNNTTFGAMSFSLLGIEDADSQAYVAVYDGGTCIACYTAADVAKNAISLTDGNFDILIGDRSGNSYTVKINLCTSPLIVTGISQAEVAANDNYLLVKCNRTKNQIKTYEIYFNEELIKENGVALDYEESRRFYRTGVYSVIIVDVYGFKVEAYNIQFNRKQPEVNWYYQTEDEQSFVRYRENRDGQRMLILSTASGNLITASGKIRFGYDGDYDFKFTPENTHYTTGETLSEKTVTIDETTNWKVEIFYSGYPDEAIIYECVVDNTAPNISVYYNSPQYSPVDSDIFDSIAIKTLSNGVVLDGKATSAAYEKTSDVTTFITSGQTVTSGKLYIDSSDDNGIRSLEIYKITRTKDENGIEKETKTLINTVKPEKLDLNFKIDGLLNDGAGEYLIISKDLFGNTSSFTYKSNNNTASSFTIDGSDTYVESTFDGVTYYTGNECAELTVSNDGLVTYLVKIDDKSYYLLFKVTATTIARYEYVTAVDSSFNPENYYEETDKPTGSPYDEFYYEEKYVKSTDTTVDTTKKYYIAGSGGTFILAENPTDDQLSTYFEKTYVRSQDKLVDTSKHYFTKSKPLYNAALKNVIYTNSLLSNKTKDTEVNTTKKYYTLDENGNYLLVLNPVNNDIENYYEIEIGSSNNGQTFVVSGDDYVLVQENTDKYYDYKISDELTIKYCFTGSSFVIKVEATSSRAYINASVLLNNLTDYVAYSAVISKELTDVKITDSELSVDIKTSQTDTVLIHNEFKILKSDIPSVVTSIRIAFSKTSTFKNYSTIYSLSEDKFVDYATIRDGFYSIKITNAFGNVTTYTISKSNSLLLISKSVFSDGEEIDYSSSYNQRIYSNKEIDFTLYSESGAFKVYSIDGSAEVDVTDFFKVVTNDAKTSKTIYIDLEGTYRVVATDAYNASQSRICEIKKSSIQAPEGLIYGYNEKADSANGYTGARLSIDYSKFKTTYLTVAYISISYGTGDNKIVDVLYDSISEEKKQITTASLIEAIGLNGDGDYTVTFRDAYGNAYVQVIHYRENPTLIINKNSRSVTDYKQQDVKDATKNGVWSNNAIELSTIAQSSVLKIDGTQVTLPHTFMFTTESNQGSFIYDVYYLDEYGFEYNITCYLLRQEIEIKLGDGIETKDVNEIPTTKSPITINYIDTATATYVIGKNETVYTYKQGEKLLKDGLYRFTVVDKAGNAGTYTIAKDTTCLFAFVESQTDLTLISGDVVNSTNVAFSVKESDTTYLYKVYRNGTLYTMSETNPNTFTLPGKWEVLVRDALDNEAYFTFTIISGSIAAYTYTVPYNYTISEVWLTKTTGERYSVMDMVDKDNGFVVSENSVINENGTYAVVIKSKITTSTRNFSFVIDTTPPAITLDGVENGGETANTVKIKGCSVGDTIYIYKDGSLSKTIEFSNEQVQIPEITDGGEYVIKVVNSAGIATTLSFKRNHVTNAAGSVLIIVIVSALVVALFIGLVLRNRSRIDK